MTKKIFFPLAILAFCMSSCDVGENNSNNSVSFSNIYNMIVDANNPEAVAQATQSDYSINEDYLHNTMDIMASNIVINNQKYSFESDTLAIKPKYFGKDISYKSISRIGNISKGGATVTNFEGYLAAYFIPVNSNYSSLSTSDLFSPDFKFSYTVSASSSYAENWYFFPIFDYKINDSYNVTTFMPTACYVGQSYVQNNDNTLSTQKTGYQVVLDFTKKEATIFILGVDLNPISSTDVPKVIKLEKIPITMTHYNYTLKAEAPKTSVPGKTSDNKSDFIESGEYQVTDFSLDVTSKDLTEVSISYKVADNTVTFHGCCILKQVP